MTSPRCSVIIPTYTRRADLQRTLEAYAGQEPRDLGFEVVVVDDGSTDDTAELLTTFRSDRFPLRMDRQENQGPAAARNRGLALATGDLVLFTGDDIAPAPDLLAQHLDAHERIARVGTAVLGLVLWPRELELTATMRHVTGRGAEQFSYHYMVDGDEYDFRHFYTSNVSVHRAFVEREPGGFSSDFPAAAFEDAELAYRLRRRGLRIRYHAPAVGYHFHHYTARSFYERQVRCGGMARILADKYPDLESLLGLCDLKRIRRRVRWERPWRPGFYERVEGELQQRIALAIEAAEELDPLPERDRSRSGSSTQVLLGSLFRYGYLRGAADHDRDHLVAGVSARLFWRILAPALPSPRL